MLISGTTELIMTRSYSNTFPLLVLWWLCLLLLCLSCQNRQKNLLGTWDGSFLTTGEDTLIFRDMTKRPSLTFCQDSFYLTNRFGKNQSGTYILKKDMIQFNPIGIDTPVYNKIKWVSRGEISLEMLYQDSPQHLYLRKSSTSEESQ